MGWDVQGYFCNNLLGNDKRSKWHVYTNDLDDLECFGKEIYVNHGYAPDLDGWEEKVCIFYGTSQSRFYRGYVYTEDIKIVNNILSKFNDLKVFEAKYGSTPAIFNAQDLLYFPIAGLTMFTEMRRYTKSEINYLKVCIVTKPYFLPWKWDDKNRKKLWEQLEETLPVI